MSDQCGRCELRGKLHDCLREDCFQHDNWFAFVLQEQLAEKEKEIERLKELNDKFMWQVRDTCARAEKAENLVAKYKNYYEVTANELTEINKQLKQVEAENAALREEINNPKRTFCAWCGYTVEIDDDAATGIAEHVRTCEKHPLNIEIDALRERLRPVEEVYKKHEVWAREWLSTAPVSSRSRMLEFWQAICKTMEGK